MFYLIKDSDLLSEMPFNLFNLYSAGLRQERSITVVTPK